VNVPDTANRFAGEVRRRSAWLWLLTALVIIVALQVLAQNRPPSPTPLSVDNTKSDGIKALYLWLGRLGYRTEVERGSDLGIGHLEPGRDTLVVISQDTTLGTDETSAVASWVRSGGRLVLATEGAVGSSLLSALGLSVVPANGAGARVTQPELLAPPTHDLSAPAFAVNLDRPLGSAAAASPLGAVVVHERVDKGDLWLLTAPKLLDNGDIARAENRRLALNMVGSVGAAVGFDEYNGSVAPASPSSPGTDWLTSTVWGVALLFCLGVLVLHRWLGGWRLGPAVVPLHERHRPLTEYVESLGGLLRRAHKRTEILRTYQRGLRRTIDERFGDTALDALPAELRLEVERVLTPAATLSEDDLLRRARQIIECETQLRRTRV
jgi:hypothetical protein